MRFFHRPLRTRVGFFGLAQSPERQELCLPGARTLGAVFVEGTEIRYLTFSSALGNVGRSHDTGKVECASVLRSFMDIGTVCLELIKLGMRDNRRRGGKANRKALRKALRKAWL